jgi:hypothetical protein
VAVATAKAADPEPVTAAEPDPIFDVIKRHRRAVRVAQKAKKLMESCDDDHPRLENEEIVLGERPERKMVVLLNNDLEQHWRLEPTGRWCRSRAAFRVISKSMRPPNLTTPSGLHGSTKNIGSCAALIGPSGRSQSYPND